jgi:prophage DNA circulation protein
MSWRDKLDFSAGYGKASFRGAPFYVANTETGVGRRTELHVYPDTKSGANQDCVWAEDLGAEADEFIVEGFVIQNGENGFDHFPERDRLIKALKTYTDVNKRNIGILVHPFYGKVEVSLQGKAKITESLSKDGGIARFKMTFVQYNKPIFKQQTPDYLSLVDTSVLSAINAALDSFTNLMRTAGNYMSSLTGKITSVMNKMMNAVNSVKGALASTISAALNTITTAISLIETLLNAPCDLANIILDAVDSIKEIPGMAKDVVQGGIIGKCSGVTRGTQVTLDGSSIPESMGVSIVDNLATASNYTDESLGTISDEQANNVSLVNNMAQTAMLGNACMVAIRTEFSSQDQMESTLTTVIDALDTLIERLGAQNDEITDEILFQAVQKLRADFVTAMYGQFADLAKEYDYQVNYDVENTLTLAYKKYDDLDMANDIFYRNKLQHPGFLPSGSMMRLLSE